MRFYTESYSEIRGSPNWPQIGGHPPAPATESLGSKWEPPHSAELALFFETSTHSCLSVLYLPRGHYLLLLCLPRGVALRLSLGWGLRPVYFPSRLRAAAGKQAAGT